MKNSLKAPEVDYELLDEEVELIEHDEYSDVDPDFEDFSIYPTTEESKRTMINLESFVEEVVRFG